MPIKPPLKFSEASGVSDELQPTDQLFGLRLGEEPSLRNKRWSAQTLANFFANNGTPGAGGGAVFSPIRANAYGTHPAFATQDALNIWLLQNISTLATATATGPARPAAPTNGHVDNTNKVWFFQPTAAYPSFSQYKVAGLPGVTGVAVLDANNSYVSGKLVGIRVAGDVPTGGLSVYVAGSGNIPDGIPLVSDDAFTSTGTTPTEGLANFLVVGSDGTSNFTVTGS